MFVGECSRMGGSTSHYQRLLLHLKFNSLILSACIIHICTYNYVLYYTYVCTYICKCDVIAILCIHSVRTHAICICKYCICIHTKYVLLYVHTVRTHRRV